MKLLLLALPPVAAALIAWALTPLAHRLALKLGAIDMPGERKIHTSPIPRLGGVPVVTAAGTVIFGLWTLNLLDPKLLRTTLVGGITTTALLPGLAIGLVPILLISLIDDVHSLSAWPKFIAQIAGASIAVVGFGISLTPAVHLFGKEIGLGWMAVPLSIFWIVGVTNAFNLIDGLDGLSAGLALISALSLAGMAVIQSSYGVAALPLVLAGALAGFLPVNIYPARMFLGDSGSASVGFILACVSIGGIIPSRVSAGIAILVPIVVLGVPITDTLLSIGRRLVRRVSSDQPANIFTGDRQHIHHRLLDLGLEHKHAVIVLYVVGVILAACGLASMFLNSRTSALLLVTLLAASFIAISRLEYEEFALIRRGVVLKYYDIPALRMSLFVVFIDLALSVLALYGAIVLKYDDWGVVQTRPIVMPLLALLPAVTLVMFCLFRVYWRTWRDAGVVDLLQPAGAVLSAVASAYLICRLALTDRPTATFFGVYALILLPSVIGVRASYRILYEWTTRAATERSDATRVIIYGAGRMGVMALQSLLANSHYGMRPLGFIDDDIAKGGKLVKGYRVFGSLEMLPVLLQQKHVGAVIAASNRIPPDRMQQLTDFCATGGADLLSFNVDFRPEADGVVTSQAPHVPTAPPYVLSPRQSDTSH